MAFLVLSSAPASIKIKSPALCIGGFSNGFQFFFSIKFIYTAFISAIGIVFNKYQAFHADLRAFHPFR